MICRITGRVDDASDDAVVLDCGGLAYLVLIPTCSASELQQRRGESITLYTVQYIEGNPTGTHMVPRLIGFLSDADRVFYERFTRVKGISNRRALRAMALPAAQLAAAIEQGDERLLQSLPEVGKKTAAQIVADLRGKLGDLAVRTGPPAPAVELSDAQRLAVSILVQWGDRRADAEHWVTQAVALDGALREPDEMVRAAYAAKQHLQR